MSPSRKHPSIGWNAALVLQAVAQGHAYGFEMMSATDLPSGTVYPLLRRLEADGLVRSEWEDEARAHAEGRPARRYYGITQVGSVALAAARERIRTQQRIFDGGAAEEAGGS